MSGTVINNTPYLRTSRSFPKDAHQLTVEVERSYIDIASAVNNRTIGIFPTSKPSITGESWFISNNQKQQTLRQVYPFSVSPAGLSVSINHGINISSTSGFTDIYGTVTNGTNWYPIPYIDTVVAANQISILVNPTQIIITVGPGAPAITSGFIVLEWLSFS